MKKKTLPVSVDQELFDEITKLADELGMTRSRFVRMILEKGLDVTDPIELLYINETIQEVKSIKLPPKQKEVVLEPLKKLVAIKAGREEIE